MSYPNTIQAPDFQYALEFLYLEGKHGMSLVDWRGDILNPLQWAVVKSDALT